MSANYKLDVSLFSTVFQAIIEFFAKKRQITAKAWQIASLVARARNDSLFLKDFERKYLTLETVELIINN